MLEPNSPIPPPTPRSMVEVEEETIKMVMNKRLSRCKVNLPSNIVELNILTKLPVKTLIRFSSLSKSWFSLISSDPYFINMHNNQIKNKQLFLLDFVTSIVVLDNRCSKRETLSFNEHTRNTYNLATVAGCYNGIVCVSAKIRRPNVPDKHHILFWNPALKTNKIIHEHEKTWLTCSRICIGFGYHKQTNDYMVVRFTNGVFKLENIEIYSSTSDSWRGVNDHLLIHNYSSVEHYGVYLSCNRGGAFFWLGRKMGTINRGGDINERGAMISLHMEDQVVKEMMLPTCASHLAQLFIYKGSLALLQTQSLLKSSISYIWLMKDTRSNSSWTNLCKFDLQRPYVTLKGIIQSQLVLTLSGGDFGTEELNGFDIDKLETKRKRMRESSSFKDIRSKFTKASRVCSFNESLISL